MSSKDNLALDLEHGVRRWDRQRWISVFSSHSPTIREVTECLGLGLSASSSTTNRGIPKFDNPDYRRISSEVTKLSKELPKERDALLDFAADPRSLDTELEELLTTYGPAIWGKNAERSCLLTPDPSKKTYNKDLYYEQPEHKEILKIHLHRWIIIKACYYIRNMKLKRPSGINEYDTLADIDGEGGSQIGTPQSHSPPELNTSGGAELEARLHNLKKRKSSAHLSMSDGEGQSSTPAKRPYNTMPFGRSASPRKSLKAIVAASPGSNESILPLPSRPATHGHHFSPPLPHGPEPGRIQLSPLSNTESNGMTAPSTTAPVSSATGFTPVNSSGFTSVNNPSMTSTAPLIRENSRDGLQEPPRDSQQASPIQTQRAYTSPYDTASYNTAAPQNGTEHRSAPPTGTAPTSAQGFQAANSPTITNGRGSREASEAQGVHHAHATSQPPLQPQPPATQQAHPQHHPWPQGQAPAHASPQLLNQPHTQPQQQPAPRSPSRNHTPVGHHVGRSLAPHPSSRSNTPLAPAASAQSNTTPNAQHVPNVQNAPPQNITSAPIQAAPAASAHPHLPPLQPNPPNGHATSHPHAVQPVLKSQPAEAAQAARPVAAVIDIRLLQCEVLALLIQYLFPKTGSPPDEAAVLTRISYLWYHGEVIFRADLGAHYDLSSKIINAWLHERQAISGLRHSLSAQPGISSSGLMDRLLAMNDLRVMRLKWKNMSTLDGVSPEDLLCRVFAIMSNTENTEHLFKDGLERLNRGVFEFLRSEDAKIVMHRQ